MDKTSRIWFDNTYEVCRRQNISLDYFTNPFNEQRTKDIFFLRFHPYTHTNNNFTILEQKREEHQIIYSQLPPESDFREERTTIIKKLKKNFAKEFPLVRGAVAYSLIQQPLEIGCVVQQGTGLKELEEIGNVSFELKDKLPLVNWQNLHYIHGENIVEVAKKVSEHYLGRTTKLKEISDSAVLLLGGNQFLGRFRRTLFGR